MHMTASTTLPLAAPLDTDERVAFVDAALAVAGHDFTDPPLRDIVEQAARHELTGAEAVAAIRQHIQGS